MNAKTNVIEFTRVKNDNNGNPCYVCHFLTLNTQEELDATGGQWISTSEKYSIACKRAKKIGGKEYNCKAYILFQSYNLEEEVNEINRITGKNYDGYVLSRKDWVMSW